MCIKCTISEVQEKKVGPIRKLNKEERRFFKTVYHAAFANPFGELREKLDRTIAGLFPSVSRRESVDQCINEIDIRVKQLEKEGCGTLEAFKGQDQNLIRVVFLFDIFHKFRDHFDQLIMDQIAAGDVPVKVSFAGEAMAMLQQRGFPQNCHDHYFAFSFQLRRAFFFISNSLVGNSPCMKELKRKLWNNVFTGSIEWYDKYLWNRMEDFSTLILGETGTGKGTAAMAVGRSGFIPFDSQRGCFDDSFTGTFISLNLSQFPETLLESELFGHKKGAFTGAVEDYPGVFDRCSPHGAILLDEIGEVANHVQIKLLQVLQDRVFTPVGSHEKSRFQGRVIAATNRSMDDIAGGAVLRDDFYYRLSSDVIEMPPLRKRILQDPRELTALLTFTVERIMGTPCPELVKKVTRMIDRELGKDYHWPGNVRELEQCVKQVMLRRSYEKLQKKDTDGVKHRLIKGLDKGDMTVAELTSGYLKLLYEKHGAYEKVARRAGVDRRTVKKYIDQQDIS
ncbi:Sigma-54 interaction domain-containing protein [Desulfocicer vacuolatum DSM 3385]|uniref:Sigma-54 interaction domain-containing protein n=1 Tax=Desulfocicer vacuolatum DSM 3385 TaxID=1121400 RepID=A0A1W2BIX1_9BACT|nr:Sigma-54 interaction domain-containing protein [Desulfocicer vacuolatum DSM 3385]